MAWLVEKSYNFAGPNFEIVSNPGNTHLINDTGICSFLPWHPSGRPVIARQEEPYKGQLYNMTIVHGSVAVSQTLRKYIESFEPGMHGFAPLILERHNGERFEEDYFLFSAQQDVDCIITDNDPAAFEYLWTAEGTGTKQILCRCLEPGRKILVSKSAIEGRHIWTAGLLGRSQMFVSDRFIAGFRKLVPRLSKLEPRVTEVDRDWIAEEQMGPLLPRHLAYVASGRTIVDYTLR